MNKRELADLSVGTYLLALVLFVYYYRVTVSTNTSASTSFRLSLTDPVHPSPGGGPVDCVPAGIALAEPIFLPLVLY